jgi:hypothetical protein
MTGEVRSSDEMESKLAARGAMGGTAIGIGDGGDMVEGRVGWVDYGKGACERKNVGCMRIAMKVTIVGAARAGWWRACDRQLLWA